MPGKRNPPGCCGQNGGFSSYLSGTEGQFILRLGFMTGRNGIKVMREAGLLQEDRIWLSDGTMRGIHGQRIQPSFIPKESEVAIASDYLIFNQMRPASDAL